MKLTGNQITQIVLDGDCPSCVVHTYEIERLLSALRECQRIAEEGSGAMPSKIQRCVIEAFKSIH